MPADKKDNLAEMIAINRELQNLTDNLDENKKQTRNLTEAGDVTQQIHKKNTDILDELAYYWKGEKTDKFLHIAHEDNGYTYKQAIGFLDDTRFNLQQEQKKLFKKEEDLLNKQLKLKQESR